MWPFSRIHNLEHETIRQEGRVISYKNRLRRIRELSECPSDCDLESWVTEILGAAKTHLARTGRCLVTESRQSCGDSSGD